MHTLATHSQLFTQMIINLLTGSDFNIVWSYRCIDHLDLICIYYNNKCSNQVFVVENSLNSKDTYLFFFLFENKYIQFVDGISGLIYDDLSKILEMMNEIRNSATFVDLITSWHNAFRQRSRTTAEDPNLSHL